MMNKRFHQYVHLERGPVKTAIINFINGKIYHVENNILDSWIVNNGKNYNLNAILNKEKLIINIDNRLWIPPNKYLLNKMRIDELDCEIEIEIESNKQYINKIDKYFNIVKVKYIVDKYSKINKRIKENNFESKKEKFKICQNISTINGRFRKIKETTYKFYRIYNSCWGKKIVINKKGDIKPCIFSDIIICNIKELENQKKREEIIRYWKITKDYIDVCSACEFRYVCFDCREIARKYFGNLFSKNPYCSYNPQLGKWT